MTWAERIKISREKLLLTQEELAKEINVSFATINRWENAHNEPSAKHKRALIAFFKKEKIEC